MSTGTEPISRVAFIGLGHMGEPMAARLVAHGFTVRAFDTRRDVLDRFVSSHGGVPCTSVADAARNAHVVVAMLPDDDAVAAVMLGEQGVLAALPPGGIAIDMGTSSPASTTRIAAAFAQRALAFVDAPVMGGVPFARDGTLDIMAGGDAAAIERSMPLFAAMSRKTYRCGPSGSGHALKCIANFANASTFVTFLEAMAMGRKFGLETGLMSEALAAMCTGRQHPLEKKIVAHVLTRRYGTGMAMGLIAKDTGIAARLGRDIGARHDIAEHTHALWKEAADRYGFDRDQSEIVRLWEDDGGIKL